MEPFNLERALNGNPVVTRDGRDVKIAGYNPEARCPYKLLGWIEGIDHGWTEEGVYALGTTSLSDLFMSSKKRTVSAWVNVYDNEKHTQALWIGHLTKALADENALDTRIGCMKVTYEFKE